MLSGLVLGGGERPPCRADGPHGNGRFENREALEKECGNFPLRGFREVCTLTMWSQIVSVQPCLLSSLPHV